MKVNFFFLLWNKIFFHSKIRKGTLQGVSSLIFSLKRLRLIFNMYTELQNEWFFWSAYLWAIEHWPGTISLLISAITLWFRSVSRILDTARSNWFNLHLTSLSHLAFHLSSPVAVCWGVLCLLSADLIFPYVREEKQMIDTRMTFWFRKMQDTKLW